MRAPRRFRLAWALSLAAGALVGWNAWRPAHLSAASAAHRTGAGGGGSSREGALEELESTRLEQALIRAENTAVLLHLLDARQVGP